MRLRTKIILLGVLPLVASLALLAFALRQQERDLAHREHQLVEETYMAARRAELKHYVDLAVSTVRPLYERGARREDALALLATLDYGPDGYFFVYELDGTVLMHSRQPELLGKNLWALRDPAGRPTIQQLVAEAKARPDGGFVDYLWQKPSSRQMAAKLGYVVALPRWNLMLGTGLYLDDIEATMKQLDQQAGNNIATTLLWIGGIAVFGVALISATGLALNLSEHRVADAKLRLLARQVVQSQEDERAHLSRELHDGVSQALVSTKFLIEASADALQAGREPPPEALPQALARLNASLAEVRHISHRLRPALLDTLGLPAALEHLAGEFDAAMTLEGAEVELPDVAKTVLFRIAQEALTNAAKHAQARALRITLDFGELALLLTVQDDGAGFDAEAVNLDPRRGIGLRNMRERLQAIGGSLSIASSPGRGTTIAATVPNAVLQRMKESAA